MTTMSLLQEFGADVSAIFITRPVMSLLMYPEMSNTGFSYIFVFRIPHFWGRTHSRM